MTQWNKARCGNPTGKRSGACSCSYCEGYADAEGDVVNAILKWLRAWGTDQLTPGKGRPGEAAAVDENQHRRYRYADAIERCDWRATAFSHTCSDAANNDGNAECLACGERDCPLDEPMHYHHDGCPACDSPEETP